MAVVQQCPSCGMEGMVAFSDREKPISCKHLTKVVTGLNSQECPECKEVVFSETDDSAIRYSEAGDAAVYEYRASELRRIRKKLGLTQIEMVRRVTGGGHNAVSRYEKGEVNIPMPLWMLLKQLDKRPEMLNELDPGV